LYAGRELPTSGDCGLRSLPDPNIVAFAMTFERGDETAYTSADDKDVDA
jgi:hypothetical protein